MAEHRDPVIPLHTLTTKQRVLVETIDAFERATGDSCTINYLARRVNLHHSTVQEHLSRLYRKGWLQRPDTPISLTRRPTY